MLPSRKTLPPNNPTRILTDPSATKSNISVHWTFQAEMHLSPFFTSTYPLSFHGGGESAARILSIPYVAVVGVGVGGGGDARRRRFHSRPALVGERVLRNSRRRPRRRRCFRCAAAARSGAGAAGGGGGSAGHPFGEVSEPMGARGEGREEAERDEG